MSTRFEHDPAGQFTLSADVFDKIAGQVGAEVLADARRGVPVDTGELLRSLTMERDDQGRVIRVGSTDVEHSVYVELGTHGMRAQPYLRPAIYKARQVHE